MKSLINDEYLKNIYNTIGKNVNNVFVLRDKSFNESEIEYISDGCIHLQFDNQIIKFTTLKFDISGVIYYLILWDSIPDTISWVDSRNITSENTYKLRDRISNFWIGKSPDFKYFYRKELSICDRLNSL